MTNAERQAKFRQAEAVRVAEQRGYDRGRAEAESAAEARLAEVVAASEAGPLQDRIRELEAVNADFVRRQEAFRERMGGHLQRRDDEIQRLRRQVEEERAIAQAAVRPAPAPVVRHEERPPHTCGTCGHNVRCTYA
jgi:hypothetical protein